MNLDFSLDVMKMYGEWCRRWVDTSSRDLKSKKETWGAVILILSFPNNSAADSDTKTGAIETIREGGNGRLRNSLIEPYRALYSNIAVTIICSNLIVGNFRVSD